MDMMKNVEQIIRDTRSISLPHFGDVAFEEKDSSGSNFFTEIDLAIERELKEKLAAAYPSIGFAGEELGGDSSGDRFWLCDPIDGTNAYVRGIPFCTTMLALIEDGVVTMSFIYDFITDQMYTAQRGKGAYCNGESISVSSRPTRSSYMFFHALDPAHVTAFDAKYSALRFYASGAEFIAVATGKFEARVITGDHSQTHDFAPGSLLVEEAGGIVRNVCSDSYDYRVLDIVACAPQVFGDIRDDLKLLTYT